MAHQVRRGGDRIEQRFERGEVLAKVKRCTGGPRTGSAVAQKIGREHAVRFGHGVAELSPLSRRKTAAVDEDDRLALAALVNAEPVVSELDPARRRDRSARHFLRHGDVSFLALGTSNICTCGMPSSSYSALATVKPSSS